MTITCQDCLETLPYYDQVGYDGPADPKADACHPFMAWMVLCKHCAWKRGLGRVSTEREPDHP